MKMEIQQYNRKKNRKMLNAQSLKRLSGQVTAGGVLEIMNKPLIAKTEQTIRLSRKSHQSFFLHHIRCRLGVFSIQVYEPTIQHGKSILTKHFEAQVKKCRFAKLIGTLYNTCSYFRSKCPCCHTTLNHKFYNSIQKLHHFLIHKND